MVNLNFNKQDFNPLYLIAKPRFLSHLQSVQSWFWSGGVPVTAFSLIHLAECHMFGLERPVVVLVHSVRADLVRKEQHRQNTSFGNAEEASTAVKGGKVSNIESNTMKGKEKCSVWKMFFFFSK